ncbi:MAG: argininosuccinate lyase [Myxococcales bacterium]|nr:argininosuccinate lyase [Myxococcales bacterium]
MPLWDGRFDEGPGSDMVAFSQSLDVDLRMWREDVQGSRAHVAVLREAALITDAEATTLLEGLDRVAQELSEGTFLPGPELEDVHMAVETRLTEIVGDVGKKLHTARSRNDQVATDVRLWLRTRLGRLRAGLAQLVQALLERVEAEGQAVIPGFTHLQRGQPILLGHHLLAHAWPLQRDASRVDDALARLDACPLGAGAMAGTPHPIDRGVAARQLGFSAPVPNAMDAVAARDHLIEAASVCAIVMSHLSRQAEEMVLWSSSEFGVLRMGEAYTTGSSIMPQKRNPDAAELVRGKAGRVFGDLMALLTMVKGLPLAYNRDLQEDRQALFDAVDTTVACVRICSGIWHTSRFEAEGYEAALQGDFLLATELADYLVRKDVPFRDAHHAAGRAVAWCEARGGDLSLLTADALMQIHAAFDADALTWLDPRGAAERRASLGGTASAAMAPQVQSLSTWAEAVPEAS